MTNEHDGSAAREVDLPANILECHQRFESGIEGPYFVPIPLEPHVFERIRPQLDDSDGDMLGPVIRSGLDKPLFLTGRPHSREQGPSWNETGNSQRGPGMMLQGDGIMHQSLLDAPLLVSLRNVPKHSKAKVQAALGTIDG
ncbi:acetylhydrolase protein [Fusarium bulbicola]|nr:acetylhydrolase protein [Fusarium bulbicola]